ncbi:hypothetical protein CsatB_008223 [Cannabis sativa]|uniref:uncharacterized protein LOC115695018 n=1 Tax=Cannabis sativa TaxID=3483 RepID=UPI0011E03601|nr:uncharacterized protein LOC115695018 [Cannabis sativa]
MLLLNKISKGERSCGTNDWVKVWIDRALVSQQWLDIFPTVKLFNLEVSTSDHCPLLLIPMNSVTVVRQNVFRFENSWLKEPLCFKVFEDTWNLFLGSTIIEKVKNCGAVLFEWGKDYSGNFKQRIQDCKAEIHH